MNTPLNPDARRAAFEAVQDIDGPASIGSMEIVDVAVSAYLAVAQPVVSSVEELDALPVGSVVRGGEDDLIGEKIRFSPYLPHWCTTGEEEEADKRDLLPARVLYLPTEELTNGR